MIPKASHIFDKEGMVGSIPFLYHEEIVDCVSPDRSASWYSDQCLFSLNSVIRSKTFIINIPLSNLCVNNTVINRCVLIRKGV